MKVRDKNLKQTVDVSDKECLKRECYWPRPDPGVFTQGVGYRTRYPGMKTEWLCGNREIHGCPRKYCHISKNHMIYQHEETGQIAETNAMLTYPWFRIGGNMTKGNIYHDSFELTIQDIKFR